MKEIVTGWIIFQLILIGLAQGHLYRELKTDGCIKDVAKGEVTFSSFVMPVVAPLIAFIPELPDRYICK